ncbi:MAG: hypothetical protein ABDH59_04130 [Fervidobacterium sp.]
MNYIELLVVIVVSTVILISALDTLSYVIIHANHVLSTNSKELRAFHILNYIRYDFTKHALENSKIRISNPRSSESRFTFDEYIDGEVKRVTYRVIAISPESYQVFRDTYVHNGFYYELANRRTFQINSKLEFKESSDRKFLVVSSALYGDILIPKNPPSVFIKSIEIRKIREK